MSKEEMKQFYLEREAHNLTIEDYKVFASDVINSVVDLFETVKGFGLEDSQLMKDLEGLHEYASDNLKVAGQKNNLRHDELPKEVCEQLEQLIGDINNGVLEPIEIKGKLENIQTLSEVYYEYQLGKDDE